FGRTGLWIWPGSEPGTLGAPIDPPIDPRWFDKPVYAVGRATSASMAQIGFKPLGGEAAGNADELASLFLLQQQEQQQGSGGGGGRIAAAVDVSGRRQDEGRGGDTAGSSRRCAGQPAGVCDTGQGRCAAAARSAHGTRRLWLVFYSPSGLDVVQEQHGQIQQEQLRGWQVRVGCIGGTTAAHARRLGLQVHAQAQRPTPESLLHAVLGHDEPPPQ
ncbi:hypothetical protein BC831DRAFT_488494, partial [Entophlyctis helioformis]